MTILIAKTQYGKASPKIKDNGILEFRGIPYGGDTTGKDASCRRFHPIRGPVFSMQRLMARHAPRAGWKTQNSVKAKIACGSMSGHRI